MVAKSPYSHTTDLMYQFYLDFKKIEPKVRLGGTYANKPGYHNYRSALPKSDYSVQYAKDKLGSSSMSAAIDLTFPDAQAGNYTTIKKYSQRLLKSGKDMKDTRGNYLREFFGNADGNRYVDGWDFQAVTNSTSDSSHLWHIHLSFMRAYTNDPRAYDAVLSILKGESFAAYQKRHGTPPAPAKKPQPVYHPVKAGDTLYGIAKAYKIKYETLQKLNPQKKGKWDSLNIGEKIRVK